MSEGWVVNVVHFCLGFVVVFLMILWNSVTGLHWHPSPGAAHTALSPSRRTHLSTTHSALLQVGSSSLKQQAFPKPPSGFQKSPGSGPRSKWKLGNPSSRLCTTRAASSFASFGTRAVPLTLVSIIHRSFSVECITSFHGSFETHCQIFLLGKLEWTVLGGGEMPSDEDSHWGPFVS